MHLQLSKIEFCPDSTTAAADDICWELFAEFAATSWSWRESSSLFELSSTLGRKIKE